MCSFGVQPACSLCCQETSVLKRVLVSTARQTRELYGCAFAYRYELTQFASGPRSGSALDLKNPAVWGRPSGTRAMAAHPASRFLGTIKLVFPKSDSLFWLQLSRERFISPQTWQPRCARPALADIPATLVVEVQPGVVRGAPCV
jgi:hypothetical protein